MGILDPDLSFFDSEEKREKKQPNIHTIYYRVATSYIIFYGLPIVGPIQRQIRQLGVPIRPDPYPQL